MCLFTICFQFIHEFCQTALCLVTMNNSSSSYERVMISHEHAKNKYDPVVNKSFLRTKHWPVKKKEWRIYEQVANRSWTSHEQAIKKSRESHEQVRNKSQEQGHEQGHEQGYEQDMNKAKRKP